MQKTNANTGRKIKMTDKVFLALAASAVVSGFCAMHPIAERIIPFNNQKIVEVREQLKKTPLNREISSDEMKVFKIRMKRKSIPFVIEGDTANLNEDKRTINNAMIALEPSPIEFEKPCPIKPFSTWKDYVDANVDTIIFTNISGADGRVTLFSSNICINRGNCSDETASDIIHETTHLFWKNNVLIRNLSNAVRGINGEEKPVAAQLAYLQRFKNDKHMSVYSELGFDDGYRKLVSGLAGYAYQSYISAKLIATTIALFSLALMVELVAWFQKRKVKHEKPG